MEQATSRINAGSWREVVCIFNHKIKPNIFGSVPAYGGYTLRSVGPRTQILRKPQGSYLKLQSVRGWQQLFPKYQNAPGKSNKARFVHDTKYPTYYNEKKIKC